MKAPKLPSCEKAGMPDGHPRFHAHLAGSRCPDLLDAGLHPPHSNTLEDKMRAILTVVLGVLFLLPVQAKASTCPDNSCRGIATCQYCYRYGAFCHCN